MSSAPAHPESVDWDAVRREGDAHLEDQVAAGNVVPLDLDARTIFTRTLAEYRVEATDWLWKDRIPAGELTVVAGDGGLGKSTFAAWLAGQITTGAITGLTGTGKVAVLLAEDDPARTLGPRYLAAGAEMSRVLVLEGGTYQHREPLVLPDDLDVLVERVTTERPDLLVVDPLTAHLNGAVDAHRDGGRGGMRQVLNPLSRLAQDSGTTVLAVFHLNKGQGPASQRIGGSAGIRNAARNVLVFTAHPDARETGDDDGRRIIGHDKCNYGPMQPSLEATITAAPVLDEHGDPLANKDGEPATTSLLLLGDESAVDYTDALRAASSDARDEDDRTDALAEAVQFLRVELGGGPLPSRKLESAAADAGIAKRTLARARKQLGVKAEQRANGWVVVLPTSVGTLASCPESPIPDGDSGALNFTPDGQSAKDAVSPDGGTQVVSDDGERSP